MSKQVFELIMGRLQEKPKHQQEDAGKAAKNSVKMMAAAQLIVARDVFTHKETLCTRPDTLLWMGGTSFKHSKALRCCYGPRNIFSSRRQQEGSLVPLLALPSLLLN